MIQLVSAGFNKSQKKSGLNHNNVFHPALRGFNVYIVNDGIKVFNFDTFSHNHTNELVKCLKEYMLTNCRYIIGLVEDEASTKLDTNSFKNSLPELNLVHITNLKYRDSYYFIFDNNTKTLVNEELNKKFALVKDINPDGTITDPKSNLSKNNHKYILVHSDDDMKYFGEYINSFKNLLGVQTVRVDKFANYKYINDPGITYIFCMRIDNTIITQSFNKLLINTEQLTSPKHRTPISNYHKLDIAIADYSIENQEVIKIPKNICIPYQYNDSEVNILKSLYDNVAKEYDFAHCGSYSKRRKHIVDKLIEAGYKVLVITNAWDIVRDKQIASCKVLLNVHFSDDYNVYESIRCDRWVFAGMPIVSEDSVHTDLLDVKKYDLVYFTKYKDIVETAIKFINNIQYPSPEAINIVKNERREHMNQSMEKYLN